MSFWRWLRPFLCVTFPDESNFATITPRGMEGKVLRIPRMKHLLGNEIFQKNPTITQDLSRRCIETRGESVSTYPRRPKAEALSNAVDVVERLREPTNQVQNARHPRDLHTFSSVTSLVLLIQLRPRVSSASTTVEPVSRKRTRNVGMSRFIQQYR